MAASTCQEAPVYVPPPAPWGARDEAAYQRDKADLESRARRRLVAEEKVDEVMRAYISSSHNLEAYLIRNAEAVRDALAPFDPRTGLA